MVDDAQVSNKKPKKSKSKSKLKAKEIGPTETARSNPSPTTPPDQGTFEAFTLRDKVSMTDLENGAVETQEEKAKRKEERRKRKKEKKEKKVPSGSSTPAAAIENAMEVDSECVYSYFATGYPINSRPYSTAQIVPENRNKKRKRSEDSDCVEARKTDCCWTRTKYS